ncbi:hypothetical protein Tco_1176696 [Tanacetum coccineum]
MGRDTIQLEDAVSTISQEYLLEFSSEYFIPENLHPELPGPEDHIVDFPEGKIGKRICLFNTYQSTNPQGQDLGEPANRTVTEVPLLNSHRRARVIQMVDAAELSTSSGTPSTVERSPLDFSNEDAPTINTGNQDSERSTPSPPITGSSGSIYQPGWGVPNSCRLDTPEACQDVASGYGLLAKVEIRAGGETFEEICGPGLEVGNAQLSQQVSVLQAQVMGEKRIMAVFEEFKKHEDEQVNARCAKMDARLDALSVDFDEELYPHMLTAIAGRRWVIGHGLRLAVMKCAESTELRQAFANVVSAGIAKGMSEGLKYGVEHGKAGLWSEDVEADTGEDAPQSIRDLRPSSSQLKIPVYPEVRNPRNPWACKDEILLEDAIAANISRERERKKEKRVVCTYPWGSDSHHARSDGIPVSVPTVAPQGLQILLADAATQTEDEESPRLLRSKSLPALFTLDLP